MEIASYEDERGNKIIWTGDPIPNTNITFTGSNNTMRVHPNARLGRLSVQFDCDNGTFEIGSSKGVPAFSATVRVGQDSTVSIGDNVSTTAVCGISATEGTTVKLGEDCMIASNVELRADDGHPIFDVKTKKRVNVSRDIIVGAHVWIGLRAIILGGVRIGEGSVIGLGSVVTKNVPNNAVAAGNPARIVRRNIAWERPHLSLVKPYYKPDASTVKTTKWWGPTVDASADAPVEAPVQAPTVKKAPRRRLLSRRQG